MKTFIKTILALSMLGVIFSCDGGGTENSVNEKNKQDIAALTNQLTELEDICTDLQSTIGLLNEELKTMNSEDAAKVEESIKQMTEKLENIEEFKADFESKIEAGEITSITDEVTAGLDNAIANVLEAGEAVGNLDVEFKNPDLNKKLEDLQKSLNSWVEDTDSTSQGFGNQETPSGPQIKVKKVKEIRTIDEHYNDTTSIIFEYDGEGKVTKMKVSTNSTNSQAISDYTFNYNTARKIDVLEQFQYQSLGQYPSQHQYQTKYIFSTNGDGKAIKLLDEEYPITCEYDSNNYFKYIKWIDDDWYYEFNLSYSDNVLHTLTYDLYEDSSLSSDQLDMSPMFPNRYASNTINMDLNMYFFLRLEFDVTFIGPHFGKTGNYFIEKCITIDETPEDEIHSASMSYNPGDTYTSTWIYDKLLEPQEEYMPLNYTFDSNNCPTKVYYSATIQKYEREIEYTVTDKVISEYTHGTLYEAIGKTIKETPVGEPKTFNKTATITYYEE